MKRKPDFTIRRASMKDLEVLVKQRRGMWKELDEPDPTLLDAADRVYRRWARTHMKNETLLGWIVKDDDATVIGGGCIWLRPVQPGPGYRSGLHLREPYLLSMFTNPAHRGRGVASLIVKTAVEWSRSNGYSRIRLHASEMGRGVYERFGFERTWEMKLNLTQNKTHPHETTSSPRLGCQTLTERL